MTYRNPVKRAALNRRLYEVHKTSHEGKSETSCPTCAEFEYELMKNKTRRDSE